MAVAFALNAKRDEDGLYTIHQSRRVGTAHRPG
jgi:hypothetical protein